MNSSLLRHCVWFSCIKLMSATLAKLQTAWVWVNGLTFDFLHRCSFLQFNDIRPGDMIYYKYFKFFCFVSLFAGFSYIPPPIWKKSKVWLCYGLFSDLVMVVYVLRIIGRFAFAKLTTPQILETISTFFYVTQIFIKSMVIRLKAKELDEYFHQVNRYMKTVDGKGTFGDIWQKAYSVSNKLCKFLFYLQVFGLALSFIPSLYRIVADPEAPVIQFSAYNPLRDDHYVYKVFYLLLDLISSIFCVVKSSAIESLYLTCVVFHISQLEYLKNWLKTIYDKHAFHELKEWTRNHQRVLRLHKHLKDLIAPLLLVIYVYNLINIATMAMFVSANGDMDQGQKVLGGIVVSVTMIYFCWGCMQSDILEQQHDIVLFEGYHTKSILNKIINYFYIMTSTRCQKRLKLTAMGLFTLSCPSFRELLATTASFLVALWQVRQRVLRQ